MGVATIRLISFLRRASTMVNPIPHMALPMRLIPGLLGMNLMGSAMWGIGFTIVDARRKKLIKRMVATPMPRHYYLLSFLLARLVLLVVEVGVLRGFGAVVFGVPVRGSLL